MNQDQGNVSKSHIIPKDIPFPNGRRTALVEVSPGTSAHDIRRALGLLVPGAGAPNAVILIVGGTNVTDSTLKAHLLQLFSRGLVHAIAENGALIIDGTTEGELTTAFGTALLDRGGKAYVLGIANDHQITWPGRDGTDGSGDGRTMLDSNYSHFVVIKGVDSDGEMDILYKIAQDFSHDVAILTLLVNDSPTAKDEVVRSVRQGWPILVIGGSGGFADQIQEAWQAKQKYIQDLSQWKPGDPSKPEPAPPFIADPVLAEVIAEGDLHFFPVTQIPEKLELYLDLRLTANGILSQAEAECRVYDDVAKRQELTFRRQQACILFLGVFITALAAFQSYYKQAQWNIPLLNGSFKVGLGDVLYYVLIAMPVVLALLIAGTNRFNAGNRWITMRAATEAFRREMFRYRTRTGIYSDIQVVQNKTTREATLARMLESISKQWVERNLDFAIFPALTQYPTARQALKGVTPRALEQAKPKERLSTYLPPKRYIEKRLIDQLTFYKDRSRRLSRRLTRLQWVILILGGIATLLAALHLELTITVTTAIAAALATYLEYNQTANTLKQYNHAILTLTNIHNWWVALEDKQADQANIDKLVDYVETTLQTEQVGWVQQMQTALTELRTQQAKQGSDSAATESINKGLKVQPSPNNAQDSTSVVANSSSTSTAESVHESGSAATTLD